MFYLKKNLQSYITLQKNLVKFSQEIEFLNDVWGEDIFVIERTVDVHVRKIREKLGKHSNLIETIKGVGYRFKEF